MHAPLVLCEQVLAIEVIRGTRSEGYMRGCGGGSGVGLRLRDVAETDITAIEAKLEVLGGYMALPFVLRAECTVATVMGETADEEAARVRLAVPRRICSFSGRSWHTPAAPFANSIWSRRCVVTSFAATIAGIGSTGVGRCG